MSGGAEGRLATTWPASASPGRPWWTPWRACTPRWPRAALRPRRGPPRYRRSRPTALPPNLLPLMQELEYTVRRSDRARRARIVVDPGGVEVVVPRRMALRHVTPFVEEQRPWIERTLRRFREAELTAPPVELEHGGVVPYLGRELLLRVRVERWRQRSLVALRGEVLRVAVASPGPDAIRGVL